MGPHVVTKLRMNKLAKATRPTPAL
jgi:hypothetical protein